MRQKSERLKPTNVGVLWCPKIGVPQIETSVNTCQPFLLRIRMVLNPLVTWGAPILGNLQGGSQTTSAMSPAGLAGLVQLDGQQKLLDDHLLDLYIYYAWNLRAGVV